MSAQQPTTMNFTNPNNHLSSTSDLPLLDIASEILSRRDDHGALDDLFDAASLSKQLQSSHHYFESEGSSPVAGSGAHEGLALPVSSNPPDIYQEDESDVGPRILPTLVRLDVHNIKCETDVVLMESSSLFNQALFHHVKSQLFEAKNIYLNLVNTIQNLLRSGISMPSIALLEMGMRVHNNLGLALYTTEGDDDAARTHFQAALLFSKQLFDLGTAYRLEHATILSNWCRVNWMRGDISESLYTGLREILCIRSSLLSWDHPDVAAAHYNLATAEYTRQNNTEAAIHLRQYLHVASHLKKNSNDENNHDCLDPIPALIYLLLLQNEDDDDSMSQELVRGLRTLQDKRQDAQGQNSASDVASVLNFVGTILFHKNDLENALLFFQEELRLEEQLLIVDKEDISESVTCNNIGRILQELNKLEDAIVYYERALKAQYGDCAQYKSCATTTTAANHPNTANCSAAANLYSTVWYNLGLIHDKRGSYAQAIVAFKMSLELRSRMLGRDHPDIACLYYNIGVLQMEQQQLHEASNSLREALRVRCQGNNNATAATSSTSGGTAGANQLNDDRVIKTLEKLASMHKNKGAIVPAIDALREVFRILQISSEYDTMTRMKDMGLVLRSISELYHTMGDLNSALLAALHSVRQLEFVAASHQQDILVTTTDKLAQIEQLISSLLLVGSLHHEMSEPLQADAIFRQAVVVLESTIASSRQHSTYLPSSLHALREVAAMLATTHCAPEA